MIDTPPPLPSHKGNFPCLDRIDGILLIKVNVAEHPKGGKWVNF
jgi:hypothetical protein